MKLKQIHLILMINLLDFHLYLKNYPHLFKLSSKQLVIFLKVLTDQTNNLISSTNNLNEFGNKISILTNKVNDVTITSSDIGARAKNSNDELQTLITFNRIT